MKIKIDRTVVQHAIEALESCSGLPHWPALQPTITALREALAAPKNQLGDIDVADMPAPNSPQADWRTPCPFCGSDAIGRIYGKGGHQAHCDQCGAAGPQADTAEIAKSAWGLRKDPTALQPAQRGPVGTVTSYLTHDGHTKWAFQPEKPAWEIQHDQRARYRGARSCFSVYAATQLAARVKLTDEQILPMLCHRIDMHTVGEKDEWFWYAWGIADAETHHGITKDPT